MYFIDILILDHGFLTQLIVFFSISLILISITSYNKLYDKIKLLLN
jgi:hypothetical protein